MKISLGTHALLGYPPRIGNFSSKNQLKKLFKWAKRKGFQGIDVGDWWFDFYSAELSEVEKLKYEINDCGLELAAFNCLRKNITHESVKDDNKKDLKRAIEVAKIVKPEVVSISLSLNPEVFITKDANSDNIIMSPIGLRKSPGGSEEARSEEFIEAAKFLSELAEDAAKSKVEIALELHHCSLADTSRSLLKILNLANHPNLSANPDLGNLYWAYDTPKEPWYEAVERLAGQVKFWHVKNLQRIYLPEYNKSVFLQTPLDEGDIDYRWALEKLFSNGFDGYISLEGAGPGDLLSFAEKGKDYLQDLIAELIS